MEKQAILRALPSVDSLLNHAAASELVSEYGRTLTIEALRVSLEEARQSILNGHSLVPDSASILQKGRDWLDQLMAPTIRPIINATGVIVHTNLGRAPLSSKALTAVQVASAGYASLEFDLNSGKRGSRSIHAEDQLTRLTGTEAALTVNNNAAAVLLMLTALCRGSEVIISRSQLVEIGGGFRVPDVMAQSGAHLVEVGTTNRTHLRDYESAINGNTAAILVAHHSNFKIVGFTTEPSLQELADLAHEHQILLLYDQGSGAMFDTSAFGLEHEPTVLEGLQAGCDVVCFSGDKLLGGPQAGILCGRAALIGQIKRHPLARAVRADKMALAALSATLTDYLADQAISDIPIWQMIARSLTDIEAEAERWAAHLQRQHINAQAVSGSSTVGGGSLPGTSLPTRLVAIRQPNVDLLAASLRAHPIPVIGRIQDGQFLVDPRTVLSEQAPLLLEALSHHCWKPQP